MAKQFLTIVALSLLLVSGSMAQSRLYVSPIGSDSTSGLSWDQAFQTLQKALIESTQGDTICLAEGIYKPDQGPGQIAGSRQSTFNVLNGIVILGGFPVNGGSMDQRDATKHSTILSGDLLGNDPGVIAGQILDDSLVLDNAFHVVTVVNDSLENELNGVIIERGFTDDTSPNAFGAGVYVNNARLLIHACTIRFNRADFGGGIAISNAPNATISNSFISRNTALIGGGVYRYSSDNHMFSSSIYENFANGGGGVYSEESVGLMASCQIMGNTARNGAGLYNQNCSPTISNSTIACNLATDYGGGVYNHNSSPHFPNCTFAANNALLGGGAMRNAVSSNPRIRNSIVWGNSSDFQSDFFVARPSIKYSIIEDGCPFAAGCNDLKRFDPKFMTAPHYSEAPSLNGNLALRHGSPAINAGSNGLVMIDMTDLDQDSSFSDEAPDLMLQTRIFDDRVDLGSIENQDGLCPDVLILDQEYNPIEGLFSARTKIELRGELIIEDGSVTTFNAPVVEIMTNSQVRLANQILLQPTGCTDN